MVNRTERHTREDHLEAVRFWNLDGFKLVDQKDEFFGGIRSELWGTSRWILDMESGAPIDAATYKRIDEIFDPILRSTRHHRLEPARIQG